MFSCPRLDPFALEILDQTSDRLQQNHQHTSQRRDKIIVPTQFHSLTPSKNFSNISSRGSRAAAAAAAPLQQRRQILAFLETTLKHRFKHYRRPQFALSSNRRWRQSGLAADTTEPLRYNRRSRRLLSTFHFRQRQVYIWTPSRERLISRIPPNIDPRICRKWRLWYGSKIATNIS